MLLNLSSRQWAVCFHVFHPHGTVIHHADTGRWIAEGWLLSGVNGLVLLDVHYSKMHSSLFLQLTRSLGQQALNGVSESHPTDSFCGTNEKRLKRTSVLSGLNSLQSAALPLTKSQGLQIRGGRKHLRYPIFKIQLRYLFVFTNIFVKQELVNK